MKSNLATWLVGIVVVVILSALVLPGLMSSQRASNERSASAILKTVISAEADFIGNDRDKNSVRDFWTKDVAGLYFLVPPGASEPIQLISKDLANADPTRPGATPNPGYWFEAMDRDEDGAEYRQGPGKDRNPKRFGFLARPEGRSSGTSVFYANERNSLFKLPIDQPIRRQWPSDKELQLEYTQKNW